MLKHIAEWNPQTQLWETDQMDLFSERREPFSGTWPSSGMTRSGTLYLLPPLVRLTSVIASGSSRPLPTPMATDADKPRRSPASIARGGGPKLLDALLPTPTAGDASSSGSRNTESSKAHPGVSLTDWARGDGGKGRLLPTPQAQDFRNCADYSSGSRGHSPQLRHLGSGRLNHLFVAWMMGFPENWFDTSATPCEPSATPSCPPSPRSSAAA